MPKYKISVSVHQGNGQYLDDEEIVEAGSSDDPVLQDVLWAMLESAGVETGIEAVEDD